MRIIHLQTCFTFKTQQIFYTKNTLNDTAVTQIITRRCNLNFYYIQTQILEFFFVVVNIYHYILCMNLQLN